MSVKESKMTYKDLMYEYEYLKVLIASLISRFGDSIDLIAFSWLTYEITGTGVWPAIVFGVNALPSIVFQPFAGVLVEQMDKRKIMVIADIGRAITVLLIVLLFFSSKLTPSLLLISTFINSTLEAFRIPASLSIYPSIIAKEKYVAATSLNSSASRVCEILGTSLAGLIIISLGVKGAMIIDAFTFVASAIILSTLHIVMDKSIKNQKEKMNINEYKSNFKEGINYLKSNHVLWALCIFNCLINILLIPISSFQVVYINETLKLDANALGLSSTMMSLGLCIGSYVFPYINKKVKKELLFCCAGIIGSLTYISFVLINVFHLAILIWSSMMVMFFVFGFSFSIIMMCVNVSLMTNVEKNYMARVGGVFNSMAMCAIPISSFVCAILVKFINVNYIFLLTGVLGGLFFGMLLRNPILKEI